MLYLRGTFMTAFHAYLFIDVSITGSLVREFALVAS